MLFITRPRDCRPVLSLLLLGSSVVERRAVNADVAGSNPALAAIKYKRL
jgi:hypothetical protein